MLGKIQAIFSTLPVIADDPERQTAVRDTLATKSYDQIIRRAREVIRELETTTRDLSARKSELTLAVTALDRYAKVLTIIQPVEKELPTLEGFEVTILLIQKEHAGVIEIIKKEIAEITRNQFEMSSTSVDEETLATIMVFSKRHSEEVHSFIYSVNVNEVRLPKEYTGRPFFEMFALIEEQKQKNTEEIAAIDSRLATLSSIWYQELVVLKKHLEDIYAEVGAYANFGLSEYTFVIMGWIPKKHLRAIRQSLQDTFGERVVVRELGTTEEDMKHAPVWYDNPGMDQTLRVHHGARGPAEIRGVRSLARPRGLLPALLRDHGGRYRVRARHPCHRAVCPAPGRGEHLLREHGPGADHLLGPDHHLRVPVRGVLRELRGAHGLDRAGAPPRHLLEPGRGDHPHADPRHLDRGHPRIPRDLRSACGMPYITKSRKHFAEHSGMILAISGYHSPARDRSRCSPRCRDVYRGRHS